MERMIQVRNVPDGLHRALKARAAAHNPVRRQAGEKTTRIIGYALRR
jgi:plasmid stability protein